MLDSRSILRIALSAFILFSFPACGGEEQRPVTWHEDVAPLVSQRCGSCHTEGNIAPFALNQYGVASALADDVLDAVESGRMPPWLAQDTDECKPLRPFKNDMRLSEDEKATLRSWVAGGTPEGDPAKAAPLPSPPSLSVDQPTATLPFASPYTVQQGERDEFQCFVLDPGHGEQVWITDVQLVPGNELVDHHGIVFLDFSGASAALADADGRFECFAPPAIEGYILATWTPGAVPMRVPRNTGMPMPPGARIVVQMHYHPSAQGPQQDQSTVELKWTNQQPEYEVAQALLGNFDEQDADGTGLQPGPNDSGAPEFLVPANVSNHVETAIYRQAIPLRIPIFSIGTHMHYVGTDMKVSVHRPFQEPQDECLIQTPRWDFNWQRVYDYEVPDVNELPAINAGDELELRCTYDNTMDNPFVRRALSEQGIAAPIDVRLGEQTLDEMCIGLFGIVLPPGTIQDIF